MRHDVRSFGTIAQAERFSSRTLLLPSEVIRNVKDMNRFSFGDFFLPTVKLKAEERSVRPSSIAAHRSQPIDRSPSIAAAGSGAPDSTDRGSQIPLLRKTQKPQLRSIIVVNVRHIKQLDNRTSKLGRVTIPSHMPSPRPSPRSSPRRTADAVKGASEIVSNERGHQVAGRG
jgi:hypothetical protein